MNGVSFLRLGVLTWRFLARPGCSVRWFSRPGACKRKQERLAKWVFAIQGRRLDQTRSTGEASATHAGNRAKLFRPHNFRGKPFVLAHPNATQ
jgi:hypothetical protein